MNSYKTEFVYTVKIGSPDRKRTRAEMRVDWRACGAWLVKLARDLGLTRDDSCWCLEGNDGDRVSDNRSTEETWPLDVVLRPLHEWGHWGFRGERRDKSRSILFDIRTKEL